MLQPADKILEAYHNSMGEEFGTKIRERIHWICAQAKGEKILDIGCSQGITSILLGREAKQVLGIDLIEESIEYAKNSLSEESEITQKYVDFKVANLLDYDFLDNKYDSIILGEVLEHLTDPKRFLKKTASLLKDDGQVIITVPFGINDYFDHKKTYYLVELLNEVQNYLSVKSIRYFGRWIGLLCKRHEQQESLSLSTDELLKLENAFYLLERELHKEINTLKKSHNKLLNDKDLKEKKLLNTLDSLRLKEKEIEESIRENKEILRVNEILNQELKLIVKERDNLRNRTEDLESSFMEKLDIINQIRSERDNEVCKIAETKVSQEKSIVSEDTSTKKIKSIKGEQIKIKEEILQHIHNEEKILQEYKILLEKYQETNKKYEALKKSKLGKITLWYWKFRGKKR